MPLFELQGHRGARGRRPENTLPSFEYALDLGVTSIETDVHLTRDRVPVLYHDAQLSPLLVRCRDADSGQRPAGARIAQLSLDELADYVADQNPDSERFPEQTPEVTPLASDYCRQRGKPVYGIPTLADLLGFVVDYAGGRGSACGKAAHQRERAQQVCLDLELKRVPFYPETIDDAFTGEGPGELERRVFDAIRTAGAESRVRIRSFDHRSVLAIHKLLPTIATAVLVAETAVISPSAVARQAEATVYCPDYRFLDRAAINDCHAAGIRVIPYTVNDLADWRKLIDWGVDGITTDFPDLLADELKRQGISF